MLKLASNTVYRKHHHKHEHDADSGTAVSRGRDDFSANAAIQSRCVYYTPRLFHIMGTLSRAARLPFAPIKPVRNYNNYLSKLLLASASRALLIA